MADHPSTSPSSLSDDESELHQTDNNSSGDSSSASTDSKTSLKTDETMDDEEDCQTDDDSSGDSSCSSICSNETTEDEEEYEMSDDEDATPKSKRVIITDFVSGDLIDKNDTSCGPFTNKRETDQKRIQEWNCGCELFPALLKIEGSTESGGIALAAIDSHGYMDGNEQFLDISEKSKCKRCVWSIPLWKVMAALNYTQKNSMCAVLCCRTQEGPENGDDISSSPSSLVTPFVSLLLPCGPGSIHSTLSNKYKPGVVKNKIRELLLDTLNESNDIREAPASLHGKFSYFIGQRMENDKPIIQFVQLGETPIEAFTHVDWMRHNEEEVTPPSKRPRMEELSSHEKLMALFDIYKTNTSHEEHCHALEEIRLVVAFYWDEISSMLSSDSKEKFLNDILEAFTKETDDKLTERLVNVIIEVSLNSIDRTTGFQTWEGIVRFMEDCLNTDNPNNVSLKMNALSILSKVPHLFGQDSIESMLVSMKNSLVDTNKEIQSVAIEWLFRLVHMKESVEEEDLSQIIPILIEKAEERLIVAEKDNEFYLIGSLEILAHKLPPQSVISIVNKGMQSSACLKLKEKLITLLMTIKYDHENYAMEEVVWDLVEILRSCANSTSALLKKEALVINRDFSDVISSDLNATSKFFMKLSEDSDEETRDSALVAFYELMKKNKKNEKIQSDLAPLIPEFIKIQLAANPKDWRVLNGFHGLIIIKPYLNDSISLCTTVISGTYLSGELNRYFNAITILEFILYSNWSECSEILGEDGISALFKQLTEIPSCLSEETTNEEISRTNIAVADLISLLYDKDEKIRAEISQFIKSCVYSSMKKISLRIVFNSFSNEDFDVFELLEYSEAESFFVTFLRDEDSSVRSYGARVFISYTRQVKNEDIIKDLLQLLPIVIEIFQGLPIDSDDRNGIMESLCEMTKAHLIDKEHIPAILEECFKTIPTDYDHVSEDEPNRYILNEGTLPELLTALKGTNALETSRIIAYSFMQKEDWKERCRGLQGLVVVAKEGNGSMEDIERMTPLLKDISPSVRSLACLALGQIAFHSKTELKERTHEMIIPPLISALHLSSLHDDDYRGNVVSLLSSSIQYCLKELPHFNSSLLIDGSIELAKKEMIRIKKEGDDPRNDIMRFLFSSLRRSEESIAPFYTKVMNLLKDYLVIRLKAKCIFVLKKMDVINCISLLGSIVDKETFIKDVDEVIRILARRSSGLEWRVFHGISRWCEIIGSDFSPLLPLVIDDIVKVASSVPSQKLSSNCECGIAYKGWIHPRYWTWISEGEMDVPFGRNEADATLTTMAKTLGELFAPHVNDVFEAALNHLKHPSFDEKCWAGQIFPLLLDSIHSQGVGAKRNLWTKFFPALKMAIKEANMNKYSANAMKLIARSIEKLGSEGITQEERTEISELIEYEVEALKKRIEEWNGVDRKYKYIQKWKEVIEALKELCNVGELILGLSFSINDLPSIDLIEEEEEQSTQQDSNNTDDMSVVTE